MKIVLTCLVGLCLTMGGVAAAPLKLTLAEVHPPGHLMVEVEERMAHKLAESSKGELGLQVRHSGELGNEGQVWLKLKSGELDMARVNLGVLTQDLPAVKLLSLPYLFRSRDHMWRVLGGDFGRRLQAEAAQQGAIVLAYYDSGTRSFYSKRPIYSLADFAGMRVRVQDSPVYKDLIQQLGGTPIVLPYGKVADALRDGEIDAAENNAPSYVSSGHHKLARYYSLDEHSAVPEALLISRKRWEALGEVRQQVLLAAAAESSESMRRLWAESEQQSLARAKKEGAVVVERTRIAMSGIEGFAVKLYSKYVTGSQDLETVLNILRSK